jgi:hypothetical protein
MSERKIAVIKGFNPTWTYDASLGESKAVATLAYDDDFTGWSQRVPALGSTHPDLEGLVLVNIQAVRREGGLITVTLKFESYSWTASYPGRPAGENSVRRYDIELATTEEPLFKNGRYALLSNAELKALGQIVNGQETDAQGNQLEDQVTSEEGLECLAKIRRGQTHNLKQGLVWTERFITDDLADLQLAKFGLIDEPPGGAPTDSSSNYLYLGGVARNSEDGDFWEVERKWQHGEWDVDIYGGEEEEEP